MDPMADLYVVCHACARAMPVGPPLQSKYKKISTWAGAMGCMHAANACTALVAAAAARAAADAAAAAGSSNLSY